MGSGRGVVSAGASYLGGGLAPADAASLFCAAASLVRAAPWEKLDEHASVFSLAVPDAGIGEGIVTVMGRHGERRGILVFPAVEDFRRYLEGALAALESEDDRIPERIGRHFLLDFAKGREVSAAMKKEIAAHGWEVAAGDAFPSFLEVDEALAAMPVDGDGAALLGRVARAIAAFVATGARTTDGVTVEPSSSDVVFDDEELASLDDGLETITLYEEFLASPEAPADHDEHAWPLVVLNLVEDHFDAAFDTLTAPMVEEIVEGVLPRLPESASARPHVRAFFAFLARTGKCPCAGACVQLLR